MNGLLDQNILLMQQVTSMMSNNFEITDEHGQPVCIVETTGSLASRMLRGSRALTVTEVSGEPVLSVADSMNLVRDTFELSDPHGQPLAHLRKRFAVFRTSVDMHLADGTVVEMNGNVLGFDFEFRLGDRIPARVSRQWSGFGKALLGRSTYSVQFDPEAPRHVRAAIIGGVIALDLIRRKAENNG